MDLLSDLCHEHKIDLKKSVINHIQFLLNTRQESLIHMPDYGLMDFSNHHYQQTGKQQFIQAIEDLIYRYEKRVANIVINEVHEQHMDAIIKFDIQAKLINDEIMMIQTLMQGSGQFVLQTQTLH